MYFKDVKIYFNNLENYYDQEIEVAGFIDKIRNLQYVQFIVLRDSFGKVQITIEKNEQNEKINSIVDTLTKESVITVKGVLHKNDAVKLNGMEIIPTDVKVESISLEEFPIDFQAVSTKSNNELRYDYRFLDLRNTKNMLIFEVETIAEMAMRKFWIENGFIEIHSPKILGTASESGAEVFKFDYFGKEAYLAQSPQFYKQMAIASGFNAVFEIGPVFRAENSHTAYHATEFTSIDCEFGWIKSHDEVMDLEEALCKYVLKEVKEKLGERFTQLYNKEIYTNEVDFPRITFQEAKQIIKEKYNYKGEKETDIDRKEEDLLGKYAKEKFKSDFIFVTNYPFEARPFYHMLNEDGTTKSFDLLYKGIEVTTGAQREHRIDVLSSQATQKGLSLGPLEFYLDFFKYGMPPHGGFGFGVTRFLMRLFELDNIRDVSFLYRGPNRIKP